MKAILLKAHGGPENLVPGELPEPPPGPGEVLIRVRACALNHLDLWIRRGLPAYKVALPHVLGSDVAGEVARCGPGVEGIEPGTKAVAAPGISAFDSEAAWSGDDQRDPAYAILGADGGLGGYAQFVRVPARNVLPFPEGLSFEEAAAFPLVFLTAWNMLFNRAGVGPGSRVLVTGAGSGIGTAAIQLAVAAGAQVLAATRSPEKAAKARKLGAAKTVVLGRQNLRREAIRWTRGAGVDAVIEHVGPAVFEACLKSLKHGGTLVTCGATTGPKVELDLRYVFFKELRVAGAKMGPLADMHRVARFIADAKLKPVVDSVFPLEEAAKAHAYLEKGEQFGKVVLSVG